MATGKGKTSKAKTAKSIFLNNVRKLTDKFSAYDAFWANGNASIGIVVAGKLGHRISLSFGNRSVNGTTGDVRAMIDAMQGDRMSEALALVDKLNEV